MAIITRRGDEVTTVGELPAVGSLAPIFTLAAADLSELCLADLQGKNIILNIFPSIDTPTCARSVREFNEKATALDNVVVICVSADLPFALGRFCGAEGIDHVLVGSTFRASFGNDYGVTVTSGALAGLLSRAVVVIDADGVVSYTEQVVDIAQEPNYDAALAVL